MKRIGILGGTFNPIHIGHLAIAQWTHEKLKLDKVIFVPTSLPPHKSSRGVIDAKTRYKMVELAIEDNPHFEVSDFEIKKGGKSYSIDTIRYFSEKFTKNTKLYFIIGEDCLSTLHKWKDVKELNSLASFAVVNRPGVKPCKPKIAVRSIFMPGIDISSSYVRKCSTAHKTFKYFLPEKVEKYIKRNKLYKG
ncbi:MAG: nicotinate-nucleotide adenylyltransferase [Candidatus Zapsychrus exili]|nr:nicotinate-nucleotide adenylyltransferase [Candidatus Zapsychrus exili]